MDDSMPRSARANPGHSIRRVAVAVALVASVHAFLWALNSGELAAPNVQGPLPSLSYTRLEASDNGGPGAVPLIPSPLEGCSRPPQRPRASSSGTPPDISPAVAPAF